MKLFHTKNKYDEIIKKYYLQLLKREPDHEGFNYFLKQLKTGTISPEDLQNILKNSEEYKNLQLTLQQGHGMKHENKIREYIKHLDPNEELRVIFGGHWSNHPGWLILNEGDQDITHQLDFSDECVDVIFTEHVIEHISFSDAINFLTESKRILKSNGVLRIVCPILEKMVNQDFNDENTETYIQNILVPNYQKENKILKELKLNGISESPKTFMFNSIFMLYDHKFIWSGELLIKVLKSLGFSRVDLVDIGKGIRSEYCIERRHRGLYLGNKWEEDRNFKNIRTSFDIESLIVEAIK